MSDVIINDGVRKEYDPYGEYKISIKKDTKVEYQHYSLNFWTKKIDTTSIVRYIKM